MHPDPSAQFFELFLETLPAALLGKQAEAKRATRICSFSLRHPAEGSPPSAAQPSSFWAFSERSQGPPLPSPLLKKCLISQNKGQTPNVYNATAQLQVGYVQSSCTRRCFYFLKRYIGFLKIVATVALDSEDVFFLTSQRLFAWLQSSPLPLKASRGHHFRSTELRCKDSSRDLSRRRISVALKFFLRKNHVNIVCSAAV